MPKLNKLPKHILVLVCDTQKALYMSNSGTPIHPKLGVEKRVELKEKSEAAPRNDRAGRRYDGGGTSGSFRARSAMEASDPNAEKTEEFASQIVAELAVFLRDKRFNEFMVVASPTFLGVLRDKIDDHLRSMIAAEIPKNLTDMPVDEIQKALFGQW